MGAWSIVPNPPREFLDRVNEVVVGFEWVSFPVLKQFTRDSGGPRINDVLRELVAARDLA